MSAGAREDAQDVTAIVGQLDVEELREVLAAAVGRHPDVERHVRLGASRSPGCRARDRPLLSSRRSSGTVSPGSCWIAWKGALLLDFRFRRQLLDQVGRRLPAAVSQAPDALKQLTGVNARSWACSLPA